MANKYALSSSTDMDIQEITKYSILNFGESQTNQYLNGLEESLDILANNPGLGIPLTHPNKTTVNKGTEYYYFHYISHVIYFKKRADDIFIIRILHKRMLPKKYL